jgi:hypothetical protein
MPKLPENWPAGVLPRGPIIFSGPMVAALLDDRKTMTRRLASSPLAKAVPGDRLWVRENWQALSFGDYLPTKSRSAELRFAATDPLADCDKDVRGYPWRPSIHMPRFASRLTLVVTEVRLERLQDISEENARAEGIPPVAGPNSGDEIGWQSFETYPDGRPHPHAIAPNREARRSFRELWEMLHGHGSWAENPELVAISFETHQVNIDRMPRAGVAA